jgi:hypothetical protein
MARIFTCTLCNSALVEQAVSFVQPDEKGKKRIWTVNILLCRNEKCLKRRGATSVEYKTEGRLKR